MIEKRIDINWISRIRIITAVLLLLALPFTGFGQNEDIPRAYQIRLTPGPVGLDGSEISGINDTRGLQVDLNGLWQFHTNPASKFWKRSILSERGWREIQVPGEWVMQGFVPDTGNAAGYHRTFLVPAEWKGSRIKLRANGIYSSTNVWINGRKTGSHEGGFTPFELDITAAVEPGRENRIDLTVLNESLSDIVSAGSNYAKHPLGGITRSIYLFAVPNVNINSFHVETEFDDEYVDARLKIMLRIVNEGKTDRDDAQVRFTLTGPDGKRVNIPAASMEFPSIRAGEEVQKIVEIPVKEPGKWNAEHPNLYKLSCTLQYGGKNQETVIRRFGFREVEVRGNELFVNNRPVKLRGVCRHEAHPLKGRSINAELSRKDAELFKQCNVNYIRTSHYPPSEVFLEACDELGIYVEDEAPVCAAGSSWGSLEWKHSNPNDHKYQRSIVQPALEMIERDRSHPSVIIWSLGNESQWGDNFRIQAELARKTDSSRPFIFSSVHLNEDKGFCELASQHYPVKITGKRAPGFAGNDRPVLFDEYCHVGRTNRQEKITDPGLHDYYGLYFADMWDEIYSTKACLGGAIWAGIDEVFYLDGREVGYGYWGLIDGWRRPKPEYWHVKKSYSPIQIISKSVSVPGPGEPIRFELENRYDFSNLNETCIRWSIGKESGIAEADIAPRSRGFISIHPKTTELEGRELILEFYHRNGYLIDGYKLALGEVRNKKEVRIPLGGKLTLEQHDDTIKVSGQSFEWVFDSRTGLIIHGRTGQNQVVKGGPYLVVTPVMPGGEWLNGQVPEADHVMLTDWQAKNVHVKQENGKVIIETQGDYHKATGSYSILIEANGEIEIVYSFEYQEETDVREIGIAFDIDKKHDHLSWVRDARWTCYPADHIGRAKGSARAFRDNHKIADNPFVEPEWAWSLDATPEGTNDFRSTKRNIFSFSLNSEHGAGLGVLAKGNQHARAYVDKNLIRLQVADYSNMGDQIFRWWDEGKRLKRGEFLNGKVKLVITTQLHN